MTDKWTDERIDKWLKYNSMGEPSHLCWGRDVASLARTIRDDLQAQLDAATARERTAQQRIAELEGEVEGLRDTVEILGNGLGSGFSSWKRCALRLRRELLRVDPANRTESQIDWRFGDGGNESETNND